MKKASKVILVNEFGEVLMQLRSPRCMNAGKWSLFGGKLEEGETPEEALVREIKEEIDYDLKEFELFRELMVENFGKVYYFIGKIDSKIEDLTLGEGDDFKFFSKEELKTLNISPGSGKAIRKWIKFLYQT